MVPEVVTGEGMDVVVDQPLLPAPRPRKTSSPPHSPRWPPSNQPSSTCRVGSDFKLCNGSQQFRPITLPSVTYAGGHPASRDDPRILEERP